MDNYSVLPDDIDKTASMFSSRSRYVEFIRILRFLGFYSRKHCFSDITHLYIQRYKHNYRFYIEAYFYDNDFRFHRLDDIIQLNF